MKQKAWPRVGLFASWCPKHVDKKNKKRSMDKAYSFDRNMHVRLAACLKPGKPGRSEFLLYWNKNIRLTTLGIGFLCFGRMWKFWISGIILDILICDWELVIFDQVIGWAHSGEAKSLSPASPGRLRPSTFFFWGACFGHRGVSTNTKFISPDGQKQNVEIIKN